MLNRTFLRYLKFEFDANVIILFFDAPETEGDGGIAVAPAPEGHAHAVTNVARLEPA